MCVKSALIWHASMPCQLMIVTCAYTMYQCNMLACSMSMQTCNMLACIMSACEHAICHHAVCSSTYVNTCCYGCIYIDILHTCILQVGKRMFSLCCFALTYCMHVCIDILHADIPHASILYWHTACRHVALIYGMLVYIYTLLDDILCMQVGMRMSLVGMAWQTYSIQCIYCK